MAPSSLISVVGLIAIIFMFHGTSAVLGGWQSIDANDPKVQDAARYAVESNPDVQPLTFLKVVSAESQVVEGTNYRIDIQAKALDNVHDYEAVVFVSLDNSKQLKYFNQKPEDQ